MKSNDLWEKFIVYVLSPTLNTLIPVCGLCGNSGMVDTTSTAKCWNLPAGIKTNCICPNGRHK